MQTFFLKIRRKETPFYAFLHEVLSRSRRMAMPSFVLPLYKTVFRIRSAVSGVFRRLGTFFYYDPMFRSQCKTVGKGLRYVKLRQGLPYFYGNIQIHLGNNVTVHSRASFSAGKVFDTPTFRVGSNTYLGPGFSVGVAREISIGSFCHIASNVIMSDNDGHPLDHAKRIKNDPVEKENVRPIRIGDNVWIGEGATVLKGVCIGQSSVVASRSVVVQNVEPFSLVAGNPARVVRKISDTQS